MLCDAENTERWVQPTAYYGLCYIGPV